MKPLLPRVPLTNPAFPYTSSVHTDIRKRFERMGWRPPSECRVLPFPRKRQS